MLTVLSCMLLPSDQSWSCMHDCVVVHPWRLSVTDRSPTPAHARRRLAAATPTCCCFCFALALSRSKSCLKALLGFGEIRSSSLTMDSLALLLLLNSQPALARRDCPSVFCTKAVHKAAAIHHSGWCQKVAVALRITNVALCSKHSRKMTSQDNARHTFHVMTWAIPLASSV